MSSRVASLAFDRKADVICLDEGHDWVHVSEEAVSFRISLERGASGFRSLLVSSRDKLAM